MESRLLLYAAMGAGWSYGSRITFSLVPDGTSIGGTPSTLFQSLNSLFPGKPSSYWQEQFLKAAVVWQQVANINLAWVTDYGQPLGVSGYQQGDSRFGDIRISAIPLADGTLGAAFSPPPINGGTAAGDIVMNSTTFWRINSGFDLETVAIHEFGHALGMNHSQISNAVMYAYYNGIKQGLTTDDVAGIQSIYNPRAFDNFNNGTSGPTRNNTASNAFSIDSWVQADPNSQLALPDLDITTPGQSEWFWVTVPPSNSGNFTVVVQSSTLSLLSPRLQVYTPSLTPLFDVSSTNYGDTVWKTFTNVTAGTSYFIRVSGASGGGAVVGKYGLLVNFGSQSQALISPSSVSIAQRSDVGGGLSTMRSSQHSNELIQVGGLQGVGDTLTLPGYGSVHELSPARTPLVVSRPFASLRFMAGPNSDPALPPVSRPAVILVTATRFSRKSSSHAVTAIDRTRSAWVPEVASSTTVSGRMRSGAV